jgi:hypothetical protein
MVSSPRTNRETTGRTRRWTALTLGLVLVLALGACSDGGESGGGSTTSAPARSDCGLEGGAKCAPTSDRVDSEPPTFSNPTQITNRWFPTSTLTQVVQVGKEDGAPVRFEITRLPEVKTIRWEGRDVDTVVRQYIAYEGRRVIEVALDFFAQADDGAVWYFGEDVFNYEDGKVANNEGTWLAGKDGPAGMIMPGDPQVGDVFRPENIPGFVFEEVTVKATDVSLPGPSGRVTDAVRTQEHLQENTFESKVFAPGYGEFKIQASDELVFMGLAVPIDARDEPTPAPVEQLTSGAIAAFDAAGADDWDAAARALDTMQLAWSSYADGPLPPQLRKRMVTNLRALERAVDGRDAAGTRQAAVDAELAALDFELQYRPQPEVDQARLDAWNRQVTIDTDAADEAGVRSDRVIIDVIRDRITAG